MFEHKKILFPSFILAIFFVLCFSVYFNSLRNPFIWDDLGLVVNNFLIKDWHSWPKAFVSDLYFGVIQGSNFYRPMQTISYMWDYNLWGLNPLGYHITNIALHALVALLAFFLIRQLFKEVILSFIAAVLFALNPLHTEAVTYISGRADLLLGVFIISSLLAFIKYWRKGQKLYLYSSLILFIFALCSKELAVVFPFIIWAFVYYYKDRGTRDRRYLAVIPFFLAGILYATLRLTVLHFPTLRPPGLTNYPLLLRISVLPEIFYTYLKLLILPVNLQMSRQTGIPVDSKTIFISWFVFGMFCALCLYWLKKNKKPHISFMMFWFLALLLPQTGILAINAFVAEHFLYLSSVSFFVSVSFLLCRYLRKSLLLFAFLGLSLSYALLTVERNIDWSNPMTFYERIIRLSPRSFLAHNNLGYEYEKLGNLDKAVLEYKKAVFLMPRLEVAHSNLANVYKKLSLFEQAIDEYRIVARLIPKDRKGEIEHNIGSVYEMQGSLDKAINQYRLALSLDPGLNFTHFNLGRIYFSQGDLSSAAEQIFYSLAEILPNKDKEQAYLKIIQEYLTALRGQKTNAQFYNDLGVYFARKKIFEAARAAFLRSIEIDANYADAHFNLGLAYLKQGSKHKARLEFKSCLNINPRHEKARTYLLKYKYF